MWLILSASRLGETVGIRRVSQGYQVQGPTVMVRPADAGTPVLALERYLKRLWGLRTGDARQRAGDEAAVQVQVPGLRAAIRSEEDRRMVPGH